MKRNNAPNTHLTVSDSLPSGSALNFALVADEKRRSIRLERFRPMLSS